MEQTDLLAFGEALAIGLLIGAERYKARAPGEKESAGLRTFGTVALLGAVAALLGQSAITISIFVALSAFLALGYYRAPGESIGLTTELAALLTFWLGFIVKDHPILGVGTAIVAAILLATKKVLHGFVQKQISDVELHDTLKFLAVVFVIYPVLPREPIGTVEFLDLRSFWLLVIVVSTLSFSAYVLSRVLGTERGLQIGALVGGVVSTTAVTVSLAQRSKENPKLSGQCGIAAVMANSAQLPRLLILVAIVSLDLALVVALPFLAMFAAGLVGAWLLERRFRSQREASSGELPLSNPYSFWPALKFALFFVVVLLGTKAVTMIYGESGIYIASAVAGLGDVSAITLSVGGMVDHSSVSAEAAARALLLAIAANASLKEVLALMNGTREFAFWRGGGLLTIRATGLVAVSMVTL